MIVGLQGPCGAGKDHTANVLAERHGFAVVGLSHPMKRYAREIWRFSEAQLFGPSHNRNAEDPRYGLSPRTVLQRMGSDVRAYDPDAWIRLALLVTDELLTGDNRHVYAYSAPLGLHFDKARTAPHAGVVIPDVRYLNELAAIRKHGGVVVRVKRNGAGLTGAAADHQSERELNALPDDAFDAVIDNNGSTADLEEAVSRLVNKPRVSALTRHLGSHAVTPGSDTALRIAAPVDLSGPMYTIEEVERRRADARGVE